MTSELPTTQPQDAPGAITHPPRLFWAGFGLGCLLEYIFPIAMAPRSVMLVLGVLLFTGGGYLAYLSRSPS